MAIDLCFAEEGGDFLQVRFCHPEPQYAAFSFLPEQDFHQPTQQVTGANWEALAQEDWAWRFAADVHSPLSWWELPVAEPSEIFLLTSLHYLLDGSLVSQADLIPLQTALAALPPVRPPKPEVPAAKARAKPQPALLQQHPWMQGFLQSKTAPTTTKHATAESSYGEESGGSSGEDLGDANAEAIFKALELQRQEWDVDVKGYNGEFRVTLLGASGHRRPLARPTMPSRAWCEKNRHTG